jgi:hypothetical protein
MLDANARYLGASEEIAARLQAREHVLLVFVAYTAVAAGLAFSGEEFFALTLPIGYTALATAFLSRHHDLVIGILRRYQHEIYRLNADDRGTPEYTSLGYLGRAVRERSKREYAQVLFIVLGGFASFSPASREFANPLSLAAFLWYGSLLCSILAIIVALKTQHDRKDWAK